jgi:hypothetical protein
MKTEKPQKPSPNDTSAANAPASVPVPPGLDSTANPARRNGRIARLPRDIRDEINRMLSDGTPYTAIINKVAANGHHLSSSNISRWFAGGYQDWLKEQACLDEMRARLDFASEFVNGHDAQAVDQASLRIAVLRLYNLLSDFDPAVLKPKMADHPGCYARILNALCKLTEGDLKLERYRHERDRQRSASQSPLASLAAALTK